MIIEFKSKVFPKHGEIRIKQKFVLYKPYDKGIILFQTIYEKQQFFVSNRISGMSYEDKRKKALNGLRYDKDIINKGSWETQNIYLCKEEAFLDSLKTT